MKNQIRNLILRGETLSGVYATVIPQPTKKLINETFREIGYSILAQHGWDYLRIKIEKALFSLHRRYQYSRNVNVGEEISFEYLIYEDHEPRFAIAILGQEFLLCDNVPVFNSEEYEKSVALLKKKVDYCYLKKIPLLKMPIIELIDCPYLVDEFRSTLKDVDYAEEHNEWAIDTYLDISNLCECTYENYYKVRASEKVGCYSCGSLINPEDAFISGQDETMTCPICRETTLISDFQGFEITPEIMTIIKEKYKDSED